MASAFKSKSLFLTFILALGFSFAAVPPCAGDVTFESNVDRTTVELGSFVQLTVTVSGAQDLEPLKLPDIDGFTSRYLGPSTRISVVNGRYSSSVSYIYNLYPDRTGTLKIPPFIISYKGQEYKTQPIQISVVNQQSQAAVQPGQEAATSLKEKIFLRMASPKKEVFVNERTPVTIRLYVSDLRVQNIQYPEFDHPGARIEDYQEPRKAFDTINGVRYQVVEFTTSIYPERPGTLELGPAREVCDIVSQSPSGRRGAGGFGSIFDEDFFGNFFNSFDTRPVTLESGKLRINVLPLPEEGKPEDFSGSIGALDFEMQVSPQKVKVGDPITVKMEVRGDGDMESVKMPSLADQGIDESKFKVYEPKINLQTGSKVLEQVVIPRTDRVTELPAVRFSYFDTDKKAYRTVTRGPFPLTVEKLKGDEQLRVVAAPGTEAREGPSVEEDLGHDIVFIKKLPGKWQPKGYRIYRTVLFWVLAFLILVGWIVLFGVHGFKRKIRTDERFARRLRAPKQARQGLREAREHLQKGKQKEFYDMIGKTLQDYFGNKFHMPPGTVTPETLKDMTVVGKAPAAVRDHIVQVFEKCEMVRYASARLDEEAMQACFRQTREIIDYFERT